MKVYAKYACHRIYDSNKHYSTQTVVTINDKGEVIGCNPLTQETPFTEWLGGVIVLSHLSEITPTTDFKTMINEMTGNGHLPLYAWHISNFDFYKEELTSQSIVKRLSFSV